KGIMGARSFGVWVTSYFALLFFVSSSDAKWKRPALNQKGGWVAVPFLFFPLVLVFMEVALDLSRNILRLGDASRGCEVIWSFEGYQQEGKGRGEWWLVLFVTICCWVRGSVPQRGRWMYG
ncbi:hypothetical protein B0J18DRAFT_418066, partial [Chaetomium sp. MPI-SDFR-AT-0129]